MPAIGRLWSSGDDNDEEDDDDDHNGQGGGTTVLARHTNPASCNPRPLTPPDQSLSTAGAFPHRTNTQFQEYKEEETALQNRTKTILLSVNKI